MKLRFGFVSNSSSCSFIIPMKSISGLQLKAIIDHEEIKSVESNNAWRVDIGGEYVQVSTDMDNFDMHAFLLEIGVSESLIKRVEYGEDYTTEKDGE
jgi:hypothetical protein